MSFFAENFEDMMVDAVTVQQLVGRADDGQPVFSSPRTYLNCRINYETHNIIGKDGQNVTASGVVWMACIDPITVDDKITFPDGTEPTILKSAMGSDEEGPAYTKLTFQ